VIVDELCQSCGELLPDGARFCPSCGVRLGARRVVPGPSTERRLITTLFCDLVGFTALAERRDPEDVDALLRAFYALSREVIEQHGGVVEKFIGDAVVGVFGVPRAHEDDPERAVRAALRLQRRLGELPNQDEPLRASIGVNTGRALVRLDVDPLAGESFQAGDAVNTAARLQTLAPPGGIVVGETTHSMAAHVTEFKALPAVRLRGRQALERPWLVTGVTAQLGVELHRPEAAPLVGREVELGILTGVFEKSMRSALPQTVLVVGEAGIGKSRLLVELARRLDARADVLAQWRQVRCSPFDEGAGLWPLAQIVREHAGIVTNDDDTVITAKLERCLPGVRGEPWVLERLRALTGSGGAHASRAENFAAWSRFIESMSRVHPTVLVVEDVQWASPTMAEFLRHLRSTIADVPLLMILTARPELLEGAEDWRLAPDGEALSPTTLDLHPLSARETERLVSLLLRDVEADVSDAVISSCGGNPLYAEEIARFLGDRPTDPEAQRSTRPDFLPPSLQALIAARLDTLGAVERAVLTDAAVVGLTFWREALHEVCACDTAAIDVALAHLAERELVRPLAGPADTASEFAFWHTVVRDVAYAMLPRRARATRHKHVADWLEHEDGQWSRAALIAHHLTTAFEAARDADEALAGELLEPAIEAHIRAALQAQPVDMRGAERHLEAASALMPAGHPRRPWVIIERGDALSHIGRLDEARACIEQGVREAEQAGDRPVAAHGRTRLTRLMNWMGDADALKVSAATLEMLRQDGPSATLVTALEEHAMTCVFAFRPSDAVTAADAALSMAASLATPMPARALLWRGAARCGLGDAGGLADLATALDQAISQGRSRDLTSLYYNYAGALMTYEGTEQSIAMCQAGVDDLLRRGDANGANALEAGMCFDLLCAGRWDDVLAAGPSLEIVLERAGDLQMLGEMHSMMALLALMRGDIEPAREEARQAETAIASVAFGNHTWTTSCFLSAVHHGLGDDERALAELVTLERATRGKRAAIATGLPFVLRTLVALDASALAERLVDGLSHRPFDMAVLALWRALAAEHARRWHEAAEAYRDAVVRWAALAFVTEKAQSQLGLGRCLSRTERSTEAAGPLAAAHAVFAGLPMPAEMAEAARLLAQTGGGAA
jgi:class 3 adenylate cyclase/tetratricopeptide (TPR) repeat protein